MIAVMPPYKHRQVNIGMHDIMIALVQVSRRFRISFIALKRVLEPRSLLCRMNHAGEPSVCRTVCDTAPRRTVEAFSKHIEIPTHLCRFSELSHVRMRWELI